MNNDRFISYLHALRHENTGTLAAYRRACGQRLAESRKCQQFASISTRPADFLTVTLVAQYSAAQIADGRHQKEYQYRGSIGAAWAAYCRKRDPEQDPARFYRHRQEVLSQGQYAPRPPSIHERFRSTLDAELEVDGTGELAHRLRGLVRMLVAEDVPIDVIQLAYDLRGWRSQNRYVQERWAKTFYAPVDAEQAENQDSEDFGQQQTEPNPEEEENDHAD